MLPIICEKFKITLLPWLNNTKKIIIYIHYELNVYILLISKQIIMAATECKITNNEQFGLYELLIIAKLILEQGQRLPLICNAILMKKFNVCMCLNQSLQVGKVTTWQKELFH